ncbi:hypothetical protein [Propionimicrobium sp. PCR01-08-3]|uniref:hypothetical protein n=1 Tax=Propionimicrobium sp. PCR01-08-3 TaxID=3052086 RepID=UPI00255CE95D|nr:hypothetical protein [Propionimicrobium sp. PCR01-08-3]WIY83714.1 hypothetical protein QQ658_05010 [Propionimicrobium sp. PCR01-08-3]
MPLQEFTIHLDRQPTDDELDLLYEVGFDDSSPEIGNGRAMIHVTREADNLIDAILSAVEQIQTAGFRATAIEDEDLVSLKTIAERVGRSYESVRLLSTGKRGPGRFPPSLSGDGWSMYSWAAVSTWFAQHYDTAAETDERVRVLAAADLLLRARALVPDLGPLAKLAA